MSQRIEWVVKCPNCGKCFDVHEHQKEYACPYCKYKWSESEYEHDCRFKIIYGLDLNLFRHPTRMCEDK